MYWYWCNKLCRICSKMFKNLKSYPALFFCITGVLGVVFILVTLYLTGNLSTTKFMLNHESPVLKRLKRSGLIDNTVVQTNHFEITELVTDRFWIYRFRANWSTAALICDKEGLTLAEFTAKEDAVLVIDKLHQISHFSVAYDWKRVKHELGLDRNYWMGLFDFGHEGRWEWLRSGNLTYQDMWTKNQPDHVDPLGNPTSGRPQHCAGLWNPVFHKDTLAAPRKHSFDDKTCDRELYFICGVYNGTKSSTPPTTTTTTTTTTPKTTTTTTTPTTTTTTTTTTTPTTTTTTTPTTTTTTPTTTTTTTTPTTTTTTPTTTTTTPTTTTTTTTPTTTTTTTTPTTTTTTTTPTTTTTTPTTTTTTPTTTTTTTTPTTTTTTTTPTTTTTTTTPTTTTTTPTTTTTTSTTTTTPTTTKAGVACKDLACQNSFHTPILFENKEHKCKNGYKICRASTEFDYKCLKGDKVVISPISNWQDCQKYFTDSEDDFPFADYQKQLDDLYEDLYN